MNRPELRRKCMNFATTLDGAGILQDDETGWKDYAGYLSWLSQDEPMQKKMEFARMSRGLAIGSKAFKTALVADEKNLRSRVKLTQAEVREARELVWEAQLEVCLKELSKTDENIAAEAKAAPWKIAIAACLKHHMACPNGWLGRKLNMGVEFGVSRYVSAMHAGDRPAANNIYNLLCAKVKH